MRWQVAQHAERWWWKAYLRNKPVDAYLRWKRDYWRHVLIQAEPWVTLPEHSRILDAGCGPAGVFTVLEGHDVRAIDPLLNKYETDLPHFQPQAYPWVKFSGEQLEQLDMSGAFDAVFCMNVINHVKDIDLSVQRLVGACRPDGWIAMSIDAHNHRWAKPIYRTVPFDILHPHQYDLADYSSFLRAHGVDLLASVLLRKGFWFDHYLLIGKKA